MAESLGLAREWEPDFSEVEQSVRRAGSYFDVSQDLRPRVLEQARDQHVVRRSARWAVGLLLVCFAMGSGLQRLGAQWRASSPGVVEGSVCPDGLDPFMWAESESAISGDLPATWNLARVFEELRCRRALQADLALLSTRGRALSSRLH